jgi:hypothetical protein
MDKIKQVLAQETLTAVDIDFLMANISLLSTDDLIRLGLAPKPPVLVVEEPVKEVAFDMSTVVEIIPKKKGRPSKKIII